MVAYVYRAIYLNEMLAIVRRTCYRFLRFTRTCYYPRRRRVVDWNVESIVDTKMQLMDEEVHVVMGLTAVRRFIDICTISCFLGRDVILTNVGGAGWIGRGVEQTAGGRRRPWSYRRGR